jgi:hypothetical protein
MAGVFRQQWRHSDVTPIKTSAQWYVVRRITQLIVAPCTSGHIRSIIIASQIQMGAYPRSQRPAYCAGVVLGSPSPAS